jgi:hypothetical protein
MLKQSNNLKEIRFKLIEESLEKVVCDLKEICESESLGFDQNLLKDYEVIKAKTKAPYYYLDFLAQSMIEIYKKNTDEKFWQDYTGKLTSSDLDYKPNYEANHIDNAIQNAFYFYFGLYAILPKIYFQTFKKELDDETFKILVTNSNKFAKAMSIIHFDMFRSFIYSSSQTKTGVATKLHMFFPDTFEISGDLEISMSEAALKRAKEHTKKLMQEEKAFINKESPSLGCPAKFVKVGTDQDLIDLIHQWVCLVMGKYFFN